MIIIFRYDLKYFKIYYFNFNQLNQKESLNIKIFKVQNSIYFVNCENFQKSLYKKYGFSPIDKIMQSGNPSVKYGAINKNFDKLEQIKTKSEDEIQRKDPDLILNFSAVNYIDTNGIKKLQQIIEDFKKVNVFVYICEPQDNVIKMIYRMNLLSKLDQHLFLTITEALNDHKNKIAI